VNGQSEPIAGTAMGQLVLASSSPTRASLLARARLPFIADAPDIDEAAEREECRRSGEDARYTALHLAQVKAKAVSQRHRGRLVLGADQLLEADGSWLDKPGNRAAARAQLVVLSGRTHRLWTAAALVRDGTLVWSACEVPSLTMRRLDDAFIEAYLDAAGTAILGAVGAYQLEGLGVHLFDRVDGDYFSVLGLPLVRVISALRDEGVVP